MSGKAPRLVQIAFGESGDEQDGWSQTVVALDDSGRAWYLQAVGGGDSLSESRWRRLPPLPDDD
jgi:hypothetical protein